ncbi:MurR/RpiR family transcriptional regulator [Listeria costaricensis]|uniref:MurR/RpiR family transcriptional regulator n=1 Tax=Listeria costaricensis TaxID=2026604 RepID=UPI000C071BA7|nr:MurR/RpiR family transcriptional regulator [Listeria costaricensis]
MHTGSVTSRIEGILTSLPQSERKIGTTILAEPEWVVRASIQALAEKADTSGAAVIRFCRSLNFSGFPELKRQLSVELSKPQRTGYFDIEPDDSFSSIKEKLVSNMVQTANDTAGLLEEPALREACRLLGEAESIYVYGVGASWPVAEDVAQKWMRSGKPVLASQDTHVLAMAFAASKKKGVFIAISNSGETSSVLEIAQQAKENGVTVISLTRFGNNKLKSLADLALETSRAPEAELRSAATSSRHAQLLTIDILYYYYATLHYDTMIQQIQKSREATNRFRI